MKFEKYNVVMLPTEKASQIVLADNKPKYYKDNVQTTKKFGGVNQHLYFLSDEKPQKYDWVYNPEYETVYQWIKNADIKFDRIVAKKIIATTDKLRVGPFMGFDTETGEDLSDFLPRPSNEFLKKYCELGGIDEVMVEYDYTINKSMGHFNQFREYKLKVAPDNTITIKPVPVKDSWNREELTKILLDFVKSDAYSLPKNQNDRREYMIKWIKENL